MNEKQKVKIQKPNCVFFFWFMRSDFLSNMRRMMRFHSCPVGIPHWSVLIWQTQAHWNASNDAPPQPFRFNTLALFCVLLPSWEGSLDINAKFSLLLIWWNISILIGVAFSRMTMPLSIGHNISLNCLMSVKWCESYVVAFTVTASHCDRTTVGHFRLAC